MKKTVAWLVGSFVMVGGLVPALATELKDKIKIEISSVGLHPGMDPGLYVCAAGHLHIKGTVQNMAAVAVGPVKVAGKAFNAEGKLLGTAASSTKTANIGANEKAEINLEFLTVTGSMIKQVKKHEVVVVEAPSRN